MKAFPLIYSRILKDDYPNGFLTRPADLDVFIASKYVIPAMENIRHVGGIRHAVFSAGDYLIYGGVACVTDKLVKRILRSRTIDFPYKEYMADKAGRPLVFFIGFAICKYELVRNELPDIDLYRTYQIYLSCLARQWSNDKAVTDTLKELEVELKTRPYTKKSSLPIYSAGGKSILRNYRENDFQEAIDYYFSGMAWGERGRDYSFLSNVLPDDAAQSPFANISVYNCSPEECARRMGIRGTTESDIPSVRHDKSELPSHNILYEKIENGDSHASSVDTESYNIGKKKTTTTPGRGINPSAVVVGVMVMIAVVVLLIIFLKM